MSNARDEILARIRTALGDGPQRPTVPHDYQRLRGAGDLALFAERVEDYRAGVHRDTSTTAVLAARGIERVVVPVQCHDGTSLDQLHVPVTHECWKWLYAIFRAPARRP